MTPIANWKIIASCLLLLGSAASLKANEFEAVDGPNVRVTRQEDGSKTIFIRTPDKTTLTKKTFNGDGVLILMTIYRMRENGDAIGCKILDGQKNELFKVSYGYRKEDGRLVEERMFDSRVKRINPADGKSEMPVQRLIYTYDAQGKRSAPIPLNLIPGKGAEEIFHAPSALASDPFADERAPKKANPNARGVGR